MECVDSISDWNIEQGTGAISHNVDWTVGQLKSSHLILQLRVSIFFQSTKKGSPKPADNFLKFSKEAFLTTLYSH